MFMALLKEKTAPDSTIKSRIHEITAHHPRNFPQLPAFAVIAGVAVHGRIPLRLDAAAESGRRNRFSRPHPPAVARISPPHLPAFPLENLQKFTEKPREFIYIYRNLSILLFELNSFLAGFLMSPAIGVSASARKAPGMIPARSSPGCTDTAPGFQISRAPQMRANARVGSRSSHARRETLPCGFF